MPFGDFSEEVLGNQRPFFLFFKIKLDFGPRDSG